MVIAAVIGGYSVFHFRRAAALTERDTILLGDFVNTTGEAVFEGTLKQALAVQLGQSPFLNIFPEERVREALRFMGRSPDERVVGSVARELCERQGLKVMLGGSIALLGSHYVVAVDAINCRTGEALAREQVEAESHERVLAAVGQAASRLRRALGESLASVQKFNAPVEQATTASLEALKAYSLALEQRAAGREADASPLLKHAIEVDPNFAMAYARLAWVNSNLGEGEAAAQHARKAWELRERVSERERFYIETSYYGLITGETDKEIETFQLWIQTYPRDWVPRNTLCGDYAAGGQYEKALAECTEALRLMPDHPFPYANLAQTYLGLGRLAEGKNVCQRAIAVRRDTKLVPFAHALFGGARAGGGSFGINGFAANLGGGVDGVVYRNLGIRLIQADALITRFSGSNSTDARLSVGVVFRLGR